MFASAYTLFYKKRDMTNEVDHVQNQGQYQQSITEQTTNDTSLGKDESLQL